MATVNPAISEEYIKPTPARGRFLFLHVLIINVVINIFVTYLPIIVSNGIVDISSMDPIISILKMTLFTYVFITGGEYIFIELFSVLKIKIKNPLPTILAILLTIFFVIVTSLPSIM